MPKLTAARRVAPVRKSFYRALEQPGDYCLVTVEEDGEEVLWVYFLLPIARDKYIPAGARSVHGVRQPPHVFRECEDGSLEIRESIGAGGGHPPGTPYYWHGFLDEGNIWRELDDSMTYRVQLEREIQVEEETGKDDVEVYQSDHDNLWYWRRTHANGRIVADGGEGYDNKGDAIDMASAVNRVRDGHELVVHFRGEPAV